MADAIRAAAYDGVSAADLAGRCGAAEVALFDVVGSTMDEAHTLAARGAAEGTVVLADAQAAGRGRSGKHWASPGRGIWMSLLERPSDSSSLEVLSLRIGLAAARVLDAFSAEPVRLKWPNDLYVDDAKLAGVLVEARWRGDRLDWVVIGLGVNMHQPSDVGAAAALEAGTSRSEVVCGLVPELRAAAGMTGSLTPEEMDEYAARDLARGKMCTEPLRGRVLGISEAGELLVEMADSTARVRSGSLVLENWN